MGIFDGPKNTSEAAGGAIGSAAGSALPFPGGSFIGSFIGQKIGGLFGGDTKRQTLGVSIRPNGDLFEVYSSGARGGNEADAMAWGREIASGIDYIEDVTGLRLKTDIGSIQSNIGTKDVGTFNTHGVKISNTPLDTMAFLTDFLTLYKGPETFEAPKYQQLIAKVSKEGKPLDQALAEITGTQEDAPATTQQEESGAAQNFVTTQDSDDAYSRLQFAGVSGSSGVFVLLGIAALAIMLNK